MSVSTETTLRVIPGALMCSKAATLMVLVYPCLRIHDYPVQSTRCERWQSVVQITSNTQFVQSLSKPTMSGPIGRGAGRNAWGYRSNQFSGWAQPQAFALPDGQNTQTLGQSMLSKIFHFTEIRKRRIRRGNPAQGRGAYRDRHERGPGGGGRESHRRERLLQGGKP